MNKFQGIWLLGLLLLSTACMQSRKGIKGAQDPWIWGAVDMCDTYPDCEYARTHLIGKLHFDDNMMVFEVNKLPDDFYTIPLALDENLSYRILAKREGEGTWRRMHWYSNYENSRIGYSENMELSVGNVIRLKPPVGYIEQYNRWVLELVLTKNGVSEDFGLGERLLDVSVEYAELQAQ